jgi:hypothetical protein
LSSSVASRMRSTRRGNAPKSCIIPWKSPFARASRSSTDAAMWIVKTSSSYFMYEHHCCRRGQSLIRFMDENILQASTPKAVGGHIPALC